MQKKKKLTDFSLIHENLSSEMHGFFFFFLDLFYTFTV